MTLKETVEQSLAKVLADPHKDPELWKWAVQFCYDVEALVADEAQGEDVFTVEIAPGVVVYEDGIGHGPAMIDAPAGVYRCHCGKTLSKVGYEAHLAAEAMFDAEGA